MSDEGELFSGIGTARNNMRGWIQTCCLEGYLQGEEGVDELLVRDGRSVIELLEELQTTQVFEEG